jgi:multiple sugar transport system substrate-binding protein
VIQVPGEDGGVAPAPTGGEFLTVPVQKDEARYDTTKKIVECMTTTEGFVETGNTFAYYIPPTAEGQEQIVADNPDVDLAPWVAAVNSAKGRTSDDLGTDYPLISEPLWTAVQEALSGAATPADALAKAQKAAEAEIG